MIMKEFKENCWIIYGFKKNNILYGYQIHESTGSLTSVDFNWKKILKYRSRIIGFNHTHLSGLMPSSIDDNTMAGWVKALGKPLICGVRENKEQSMYLYERKTNLKISYRPVLFKKIGNLIKIRIW